MKKVDIRQQRSLEKFLGLNSNFGGLVSISGFWKNDVPEGFGCMLIMNEENYRVCEKLFRAYVKHYEESNKNERSESIDKYKWQLNNRTISDDCDPHLESILLITNIWFLEKYTSMTIDNFNGALFVQGK